MSTQKFYELARLNDEFESDEQVEQTERAVLKTLGEGISRGEAEDLAETLPANASGALLEGATEAEVPESPDLDEFYDTVAERAGLDREETPTKTQAIGVAVTETAGEDEVANAREQLPPGYDEVFEPPGTVRREPFDAEVRERLGLDSDPEARDVAAAVLEGFGERLAKGEAEVLANFLPADLEDAIVVDEPAKEQDYGPVEFLDRVGDLASVDKETANEYARAVLRTLAEVVPEDELDRATDQLPPEYDEFFESEA